MTTQELTRTITTPYEDLRIWAYRIVGEEFNYYPTGRRVRPARAMPTWKRLFCLLFPFGFVMLGIAIFEIPWFFAVRQYDGYLAYLQNAPLWNHLLFLGMLCVTAYGCISGGLDVLYAQQIVFRKLTGEQAKNTEEY